MNRLDAIKARAEVVATKPENREATYAEFGAVLRLACFDVPALVSAVEAVLALHSKNRYEACNECYDRSLNTWADLVPYPCPTVTAIREALGETE